MPFLFTSRYQLFATKIRRWKSIIEFFSSPFENDKNLSIYLRKSEICKSLFFPFNSTNLSIFQEFLLERLQNFSLSKSNRLARPSNLEQFY